MEEPKPTESLSPGHARPHIALLLAVFAVAMSVLGFEVALTRAFSVLLRFHFVFLAISLATCGMGIGGLIDFILRRRVLRTTGAPTFLVSAACIAAALMPLSFYLLFATPLSARLTSVWVVTAICLPPFLAAGAFLSHAFAWQSAQGGRMYFADLTGAALGSFLVIGALQLLGGINAGIVWGLVTALGALSLTVGFRLWRLFPVPAVLAMGVLALVLANRTGALIDTPVLPLADDPNAKPLFQELGDPSVGAKIVATEWNAFARTDVVSNRGTDDLYLYTDGEVPTNMLKFDGNLDHILPRLQQFIGFYAFEQVRPDKVLLIGPGGGLDILLALAVNARQIDGAELNPSIPRMVRRWGDFTGHVYDMEGVNIRVDEGRSFVRRSKERYDLIYMALTKTATTASSSLALVESYIHTTEAFEEMLGHLTERGSIAFVAQSPLVLMRTMLTAVAALQAQGVPREQAVRHVSLLSVPPPMMVMGPYRYMLLVGRSERTAEQSRKLATQCVAQSLEPLFFPGAYEPQPFDQLTRGGLSDRDFVRYWNQFEGIPAAQWVDFGPCPDDRPFVVDMSIGVPPQFSRFLGVAVGLVVLLTAGVAFWLRRSGDRSVSLGGLARASLYFCLLGSGFMLIEIVLTQRLVLYLGYPVLSLSVILFSLLLGGGLGSLWSQSWPAHRLAARAATTAFLVAVAAVAVFKLQPIVEAGTLACDIRVRCALAMCLLMPLGFLMGTPFPTGVRLVGSRNADLVPWMWGLNGLTSVVGSVGAMSLAKLYGFTAVLMVGGAIYLCAAALGGTLRRLSADS
jgi:predicted membrane-bound spermidine synthase